MLTNQSRFQLKLACLSASTYDVLMKETGGDEAAVDEHIKQSMGRWGFVWVGSMGGFMGGKGGGYVLIWLVASLHVHEVCMTKSCTCNVDVFEGMLVN